MKFSKLELKTDKNLRVMYNTFQCYRTKDSIEVNVTIKRSTNNILKMLKHPHSTLDEKM